MSLRKVYIEAFKKYPQTIRIVLNGKFYESIGLDALILNEKVNLNISTKYYKKKPYVMAGFPPKTSNYLEAIVQKGLTAVIYEHVHSTSDVKNRAFNKFISPGLAPLTFNIYHGPIIALKKEKNGYLLYICDLRSDLFDIHKLNSIYDVIKLIISYKPCELLMECHLLHNNGLVYGPGSFNPFAEVEMDALTLKDFKRISYTSDDCDITLLLKKIPSTLQIRPLNAICFQNDNPLQHYLDWATDSKNLVQLGLKSIKERVYVPSATKKAITNDIYNYLLSPENDEDGVKINKLFVTKKGAIEVESRLNRPFLNTQELSEIQEQGKSFYSLKGSDVFSYLELIRVELRKYDKFNHNHFLTQLSKQESIQFDYSFCLKWIQLIVGFHQSIAQLSMLLHTIKCKSSHPLVLENWEHKLHKLSNESCPEIANHFGNDGSIRSDCKDLLLIDLRSRLKSSETNLLKYHKKLLQRGLQVVPITFPLSETLEFIKSPKRDQLKVVKELGLQLSPAKKNKKFTSLEFEKLYQIQLQLQTELTLEYKKYLIAFYNQISHINSPLHEINSITTAIDVAIGGIQMAMAYTGQWTFPILNSTKGHAFKEMRYPFEQDMIPNNSFKENKFTTIGGSNMGGKSTYLKSIATTYVLGQIGFLVPCSSASFKPVDAIFCPMNQTDSIQEGLSLFGREVDDMTALNKLTSHSLVQIDEMGSSTSSTDQLAFFVIYINKLIALGCQTIISTHHPSLCDYIEHVDPSATHFHFKNKEYKLNMGISESSDGLDVIEDFHPIVFTQEARDKVKNENKKLRRDELRTMKKLASLIK